MEVAIIYYFGEPIQMHLSLKTVQLNLENTPVAIKKEFGKEVVYKGASSGELEPTIELSSTIASSVQTSWTSSFGKSIATKVSGSTGALISVFGKLDISVDAKFDWSKSWGGSKSNSVSVTISRDVRLSVEPGKCVVALWVL